ncbi:hypothetical protein PoB_005087200 [Plakobranchus ocellatus]|uniref:Uncharacterized protein n=1 Tax=Plakobranchus ocellatus TaxID=259542 RepID=A0AAV4BZ12_9GAST|nr:hypothetical protein PoB_005087200 [Plakobranchus ocellatus]
MQAFDRFALVSRDITPTSMPPAVRYAAAQRFIDLSSRVHMHALFGLWAAAMPLDILYTSFLAELQIVRFVFFGNSVFVWFHWLKKKKNQHVTLPFFNSKTNKFRGSKTRI